MYTSRSTKWFYDLKDYDRDLMPDDVVEISAEYHRELVDGLSAGKVLFWDEAGRPFLADPVLTPEQITAALTADAQAHMDSQARTLGYDDIKSAVTYADEPAVPRFQAEGLAFRSWRSQFWTHCYAVLAAVTAGERAIPTSAELIAEGPKLVLPA